MALEKRVPGKLTELLFLSARCPLVSSPLYFCVSPHTLFLSISSVLLSVFLPWASSCLSLLLPSSLAVRGHGPTLPAASQREANIYMVPRTSSRFSSQHRHRGEPAPTTGVGLGGLSPFLAQRCPAWGLSSCSPHSTHPGSWRGVFGT